MDDRRTMNLKAIHATVARDTAGWVYSDSQEIGVTTSASTAHLARLGHNGDYGGNVQRDLSRWMRRMHHSELPINWSMITVWDSTGLHLVEQAFPQFLPHELFHATWQAGRTVFERTFFGPTGAAAVDEFWHEVRNADWYLEHPVSLEPALLPWSIPARMHGDEGQFTEHDNDSIIICSIHGELSTASTLDSRLLCFALPTSWVVQGRTLREAMRPHSWSWSVAFDFVMPSNDCDGNEITRADTWRYERRGMPIAGGYRLAFVGELADWAYHAKLHWPYLNVWNHNFCCHRCFASQVLLLLIYTALGPNAGWLDTVLSNAAFLASIPPEHWHSVLDIPGFHIRLMRVDVVHNLLLGMLQYNNGSIIWDLMLTGHFGALAHGTNTLLRSAHSRFFAWCCSQGVRCSQPRFTPGRLGMSEATNYPCLDGKAHNMRIVTAWLADETQLAADLASPHGQKRAALAYLQGDFLTAIESEVKYLSQDHALLQRILSSGYGMLFMLNDLANDMINSRRNLYHITPKFHQFVHLLMDVAHDMINPRTYQGYADEDFVGRIVEIAKMVHRSVISLRVLDHWSEMMGFRWSR